MAAHKTLPRLRPDDFRRAIESAVQDGHAPEAMTLHLTHRDESDLKRDRKVPVEDISFGGGEMRYLGVRVVCGGVAVSSLDVG